jgi:Fe-S cluster assembly protein SufD
LTTTGDYQAAFVAANGKGFSSLRSRGMERFLQLGFPTSKQEDWRFTSAREIAEGGFDLAPASGALQLSDLDRTIAGELRLVFENGAFRQDLSDISKLPAGVIACDLSEAMERHRDLIEPRLGSSINLDRNAFAALNTALFTNGFFLYVPKGLVMETPIHMALVSNAGFSAPRNLILVGENAQCSLVESYISLGGRTFTNAVTESFLESGSVVEHVKLQLGAEDGYHVSTLQGVQLRSSNYRTTTVTLGNKLTRNDTGSILDGDGSECTLNGLYVGRGEQHIDNHTTLDHAKAHCPSHELFKGVLADKASAVFSGKIIVRPDAQKTDSKQSNMNLLLSDDATVNTIPQLEIFADDVRCTHGATIGRLDADALFYLRSRGIPELEARNLLIYAFASDVIDRIGVPEIRARLEEMLFERFAEVK